MSLTNFTDQIISKKDAPKWFYEAIRKKMGNKSIIGLIKKDIRKQLKCIDHNPKTWDKKFIDQVAKIIFDTYSRRLKSYRS